MRKMEDLEDKTYIIFAQANLWRSPNASNELGYYINKLMSCYKYDGPDQAGLIVNRMPEKDTNYINRLSNVGIRINDSDVVISRPSAVDREKYKVSYRREQAKIASSNTKMVKNLINSNTASTSDTSQTQSQTQSQHRNLGIKQDPRTPAGFVVGIQEPHFKHKKFKG